MTNTRTRTLAVGAALGTVLSLGVLAAPSQAASTDRARHFANCTAMHKVFKHGVARSLRASRRDGHGAVVRPAVYRANKGSDRDGDGVACEA